MQQLAGFAAECNCIDPRLYGDSRRRRAGCRVSRRTRRSPPEERREAAEPATGHRPKKRDDVERPAYVPDDLPKMETEEREAELTTCQNELMRIQRDCEAYNRGELPWDNFMKILNNDVLANDKRRYDTIPENYNGMNVADFDDANIEKLVALEREEDCC